jgi:hypothetical protein
MAGLVSLVAESPPHMDAHSRDELVHEMNSMYRACLLQEGASSNSVDMLMQPERVGQQGAIMTSVSNVGTALRSALFGKRTGWSGGVFDN